MSDYLLGMSDAEVQRLRHQHEVWRRHTEAVWRSAGFGAGQTVVDLGCGPGFTSIDLAGNVGSSGRVIAVDASERATAHLSAQAAERHLTNIEIVTADVTRLDISAWKPDAVFARWLFPFLADPPAVVGRLAAGLEPGATMVVVDYWNYLAIRTEPPSPIFGRVFRAVYESFAAAGGSLDVGGTLPAAFEAHGMRVTRTEPLVQVGGPGSPCWRWLEEFQNGYLPTLAKKGMLEAPELDAYQRWWTELAANPASLLFTPPILSVTAVKT